MRRTFKIGAPKAMHKKNSPLAPGKRVRFISLGCPKNLVDSESILGHLNSAGYQICSEDKLSAEQAGDFDIFIVNTCCFIKEADQESRDIIRQSIKLRKSYTQQHPEKKGFKIIVSGCLAQRSADKLNDDFDGEIDGIIGVNERDKIVWLCDELTGEKDSSKQISSPSLVTAPDKTSVRYDNKRLRITPPHYAYLRIAEGCDNRCSYCVIPDIHGNYRSKPLNKVLEEARYLIDNGAKELNLIAQDTTSYGKDLGNKINISVLLSELAKLKGVGWIRLLYTHPAYFADELIDTIAGTGNIVKYVDLPVQHISEKILSRMRRHVTREKTISLIHKIRQKIPNVFIRTTAIVGFPGETEKDFSELLDFIKEMEFERLGAFQYSKEKGTSAYGLSGQISNTIKKNRLDKVMTLQQRIAFKKNESLVGKIIESIVDSEYDTPTADNLKSDRIYLGRTYGDAPEVDGNIIIKSVHKLKNGAIIKIRITKTQNYDLVGETVKE